MLRSTDDATVRRAAAELPLEVWRAASPDRPTTLVHGDWHLGQLGRRSETAPWLLIDVDDLGVGDPAWDLARPAGFWAAGLIPDEDWAAFLESYRDAGGRAVPPGDPWPALEPFARAAVVHAAAAGIAHGDDDETQSVLRTACTRMF
jgi:aminoglycoside phosphotransferase (APT) family kinase protein